MIQQTIARLKAQVASPFKHVGGATDLMAASEQNPKLTPAVFVLANDEDAAPPATADVLIQRVAATIGVILVVKNVSDTTGAAAATDMETLRRAVRTALYGWQPDSEYDPLERGRGKILAFRDGHLWWMDTFNTSYLDKANQ